MTQLDAPAAADTHNTAPTRFVEAGDNTFAYRRFGLPGEPPVLFIQHFRGNLDNFDPAITDALAASREVILFDNVGVGASTGKAPNTIAGMAADTARFVLALGLAQVDVLAHSMGGQVAQQLAATRPSLVRKLILVGTGPRGGTDMVRMSDYALSLFTIPFEPADLMWIPIQFSGSEAGQAAGRAYLKRIRARTDRDSDVSAETAMAHAAAAAEWGRPYQRRDYLQRITHPVLVVNGSEDVIIPTVNSFLLQQELPNAELVIYPDSNHGAHFQYHERFAATVLEFLDR
ncbi:alpha/beta fold hydrolase [Gryllotalpicola protaetiae]|uniref:Alpha/beta hydrolase n=1 Tax=Gryllotalpicola protaetiae TaxID=2419771 RepID=A0A387BSA6_9MICO|nr:alpha/beta hydrolase [Gryllotalpicola protaetiae]AYG03940.1 alpha/beta hydrolase [Gryllotalpicola protaetiae]